MVEHGVLLKTAARAVLLLSLAAVAAGVGAKEAATTAEDPVLEKRTMALSAELRCLVCQNQTIADSNAGLAVDLRDQVRQMLREGKTEQQILDFMTQRYGDFVLYRPPVKNSTALLWFGPPALLAGAALTLWLVLRKRSRMAADQFEPDEADASADENANAVTGHPNGSGPGPVSPTSLSP
jgi:cytochrome c-type biogenesis protein CcmH